MFYWRRNISCVNNDDIFWNNLKIMYEVFWIFLKIEYIDGTYFKFDIMRMLIKCFFKVIGLYL